MMQWPLIFAELQGYEYLWELNYAYFPVALSAFCVHVLAVLPAQSSSATKDLDWFNPTDTFKPTSISTMDAHASCFFLFFFVPDLLAQFFVSGSRFQWQPYLFQLGSFCCSLPYFSRLRRELQVRHHAVCEQIAVRLLRCGLLALAVNVALFLCCVASFIGLPDPTYASTAYAEGRDPFSLAVVDRHATQALGVALVVDLMVYPSFIFLAPPVYGRGQYAPISLQSFRAMRWPGSRTWAMVALVLGNSIAIFFFAGAAKAAVSKDSSLYLLMLTYLPLAVATLVVHASSNPSPQPKDAELFARVVGHQYCVAEDPGEEPDGDGSGVVSDRVDMTDVNTIQKQIQEEERLAMVDDEDEESDDSGFSLSVPAEEPRAALHRDEVEVPEARVSLSHEGNSVTVNVAEDKAHSRRSSWASMLDDGGAAEDIVAGVAVDLAAEEEVEQEEAAVDATAQDGGYTEPPPLVDSQGQQWLPLQTEEGHVYYWNQATGETQWEPPT
mmetsp:Transcript_16542/g.36565  ORF Transcript_16542/g.36565 Transcript_16542/m.36565 type:complete len:497 (+) Transcript_16542:63-1553(+)